MRFENENESVRILSTFKFLHSRDVARGPEAHRELQVPQEQPEVRAHRVILEPQVRQDPLEDLPGQQVPLVLLDKLAIRAQQVLQELQASLGQRV